MNKCKNKSDIKCIYLVDIKDLVIDFEKGSARMKRKYGKFKRQTHKFDLP